MQHKYQSLHILSVFFPYIITISPVINMKVNVLLLQVHYLSLAYLGTAFLISS